MPLSQYISDESFDWVLDDLNFTEANVQKKNEILSRAVGAFEADMAQKFVVPLIDRAETGYANAPEWARNKVLNCVKSKIREIVGYDNNRNLTGTIDSTEKFINVHGIEYKGEIKTLLNPKIDFGFKQLEYTENANAPVQRVALSRANNQPDPYDDDGL